MAIAPALQEALPLDEPEELPSLPQEDSAKAATAASAATPMPRLCLIMKPPWVKSRLMRSRK